MNTADLHSSSGRSWVGPERSPSKGSHGKKSTSSQQQNDEQQQKAQKIFYQYLTTVVIWWRTFNLWFKLVFITRKEYVPGDTYRFIWQTVPEVKRSFLYYRVGHVVGNFFVFFISFFHVNLAYDKNLCENEPAVLCLGTKVRVQYEWLFYATRWGIMINMAQSIWALVLTLQVYLRQRKLINQETAKPKHVNPLQTASEWSVDQTGVLKSGSDSSANEHKLFSRTGFYWCLHSYAIIACAIIDTVYWGILWPSYNTRVTKRFFNELNEHAFNFLLMASDYAIVAFPVILTHVLLTFSIPSIYLFISYIYYLAGGKSEDRAWTYLYSFINWKKPSIAIGSGVCLILLSSFILFVLLLIDHYKFKYRPQTLLNKNRPPTQHP